MKELGGNIIKQEVIELNMEIMEVLQIVSHKNGEMVLHHLKSNIGQLYILMEMLLLIIHLEFVH